MTGHSKWNERRERMTPARKERVRRRTETMLQEMLLAEIRQLAGLTQTELAEALEVSQASVSKAEHATDMQISTLRRIVEALGGQLEITVKLPTGSRITVSQFDHEAA